MPGSAFRDLLAKFRQAAVSPREKGTYFERLTKIWLENALNRTVFAGGEFSLATRP